MNDTMIKTVFTTDDNEDVFFSSDRGHTWTAADSKLSGTYSYAASADESILLACSGNGVLRSTDHGAK